MSQHNMSHIATLPSVQARSKSSYEQRTPAQSQGDSPEPTRAGASSYKKRKETTVKARVARPKRKTSVSALAATRSLRSIKKRVGRKRLALLLPGHNEELIIAHTIRSAIKAGQRAEDIFVSDDGSEDNTRAEALKLLPAANVLSSPKGGKAQAVYRGIKHFQIEDRYVWVHVADADSVFSADYFRIFRRKLDAKKYAVALGFVQSLRGNWISTYRAFIYTFGQHIVRRIQSWFGMISVFPGAITCFRTDIIKHLDFSAHSLTEDFDLTMQVHRKHLGKIRFIPEAINYTQDPLTLKDFCKQNLRWQRGFFQGVAKYRVGTKLQAVDIGILYILLELLLYIVQMFVLVPYFIFVSHNWMILPAVMFSDFLAIGVLAIFSAVVTKRPSIILALPIFYFLRWVEVGIIIIAFVEVVALRRFRTRINGWETKGRRYALDTAALKDTA